MDVTARFVDVSGEETNACESLELSTLAKYVPQYWLFLDSPGISKTEMRNYLGNKAAHEGLMPSSYEPCNRAGSVTGTNFVVCSYGKFQAGRPG